MGAARVPPIAIVESKPSSTGVKLLSANPRVVIPILASGTLAPGLNTITQLCPVAIVPAFNGVANAWPVLRNWVYRFSGDAYFSSAAPLLDSLESAGMLLELGGPVVPPTRISAVIQRVNAARLSTTTALAQDVAISFDPWEIDNNDLLTYINQLQGPAENRLADFGLELSLVVNNTDSVPHAWKCSFNIQVDAAQFSDYRFSKWE